jgi:hypothetical protein
MWALSFGVKQPEHEADYLSPSNASINLLIPNAGGTAWLSGRTARGDTMKSILTTCHEFCFFNILKMLDLTAPPIHMKVSSVRGHLDLSIASWYNAHAQRQLHLHV